jgi:D-threo-aldose 1-dehydrogenase
MLEPNPRPAGSDLAAGGFAVPDTLRRRFDFSAAAVRRSLEGSLGRLGLDRADLVYVHDPDDHVDEAIAGAIPELIRMREEGLVSAVGVGMNQWQAPLRMVRETGIDLVMLAGRWTLLDRSGQPLVDECAARGVAVVAAAPFNSGLLARAWPGDGAYFDYGPAPTQVLARARALAGICQRHGVSLPDAAIQFPLRHPAVVSVVGGMRSGEEVAAALARFATVVPDDAWTELDAC